MTKDTAERTLKIIKHLHENKTATYSELQTRLAPISHTGLTNLLKGLQEIGEIEHFNRVYSLSYFTKAESAYISRALLPRPFKKDISALIESLANELMRPVALFGWVGESTMKIMERFNLPSALPYSHIGKEWPLIPFHGYAQIFLAHAEQTFMMHTFFRWDAYLRVDHTYDYKKYQAKLKAIRKNGYTIEDKEERSDLVRVAIPVFLEKEKMPRYALGVNLNSNDRLAPESFVPELKKTAEKLSELLPPLELPLTSPYLT